MGFLRFLFVDNGLGIVVYGIIERFIIGSLIGVYMVGF